jgi:hypothetical protein
MRYVAISIVLLVVAVSKALGQSAPTSQPDAEALVAQLGDPEWSVRESAQEQLVAMGESVVPRLLRAAKETSSDEVRQRTESAIAQIGENQLSGPSLITIHLKDASVKDAFAELSRQAGANLQPMPSGLWDLHPWPKITIDLDRQPFWSALRAVSAQAGVELRQWNDGFRLLESGAAGPSGGGRFMVSGPFLITLLRCTRMQSIEYGLPGGENPNSDFDITFSAVAEPKLRVLRASNAAKLEEATDDLGNSLVPRSEDAPGGANAGAANANAAVDTDRGLDATFVTGAAGTWQFSSRLDHPQRMGKRLVKLRGTVNVLLQRRVATMEIPSILSSVKMSRVAGGLRLTLNDAKKVGSERYDLSITIARDGSGVPVDWDRVQQSINDLKLIDANGRSLARSDVASNHGNETIDLSVSFTRSDLLNLRKDDAPADPVKLVWPVATETKQLSVPFEFKDVPLPE